MAVATAGSTFCSDLLSLWVTRFWATFHMPLAPFVETSWQRCHVVWPVNYTRNKCQLPYFAHRTKAPPVGLRAQSVQSIRLLYGTVAERNLLNQLEVDYCLWY